MASTVKMTIPKPLSTQAFRTTLMREMKAYAPHIVKDFEHTIEGFSEIKPTFTSKPYILPHSIGIKIEIGGDDKSVEVWNYLDAGTKPHIIRPKKKGGTLVFKWGGPGSYKSGSKPGRVITTTPSMSEDSPTNFRKYVNHPGFEARKWRKTITDLHTSFFTRWMQAAYNIAAYEQGYPPL